MHKKGEFIIYKKEVCKIVDILPNFYHNKDYYLLDTLSDSSLSIKIPVDNKEIRNLITKKEVTKIIKEIPLIKELKIDSKSMENTYKKLLSSGKHEDLIRIIKTSYLRNKERIDNNKKTTDKDNYYFNLAEKYLYQEFGIVLNMTYDETKEYVIKKVNNLIK